MATLAVIEDLDVLPDGGFGLGSGGKAAVVYQFALQAPQKLSIGALSKQFSFRDIDVTMPNCSCRPR